MRTSFLFPISIPHTMNQFQLATKMKHHFVPLYLRFELRNKL